MISTLVRWAYQLRTTPHLQSEGLVKTFDDTTQAHSTTGLLCRMFLTDLPPELTSILQPFFGSDRFYWNDKLGNQLHSWYETPLPVFRFYCSHRGMMLAMGAAEHYSTEKSFTQFADHLEAYDKELQAVMKGTRPPIHEGGSAPFDVMRKAMHLKSLTKPKAAPTTLDFS